MEWTEETVLGLIELYRVRPVLWNPECEVFEDKNKRHNALMEIAEICDVRKEELERKIKKLRNRFTSELKKVIQSKKLGSGSGEIYKSKWYAFEPLQFLSGRNKARGIQDTATQDLEHAKIEDLTNTGDYEDPLTFYEDNSHPARTDGTILFDKVSTRKRKPQDPHVDGAKAILKDLHSRINRDEYDLFGEYIAIKIRKLVSHNVKIRVQHTINNALFEAQIGKYNSLPQISAPRSET